MMKVKETETTQTENPKPRRGGGQRHTNAAERLVRLLVQLPKSVREPTVMYALAVAKEAPELKREEEESDQLDL
jgi:hypothetical protein